MPSYTVKNIPTSLYKLLKESAEANRRSINNEILVCIEKAVKSQPIRTEAVLARARKIRESTRDYVITDEELDAAKNMGRQ